MKVHTTKQEHGRVLRWHGHLTSAMQAYNFGHSDAAEDCCEQLGLPDVNVFYIFKIPQTSSGATAA